jgi:hypothetical protein
VISRDTSPEAAAAQIAAQRRLSGPERLAIALEMSLLARELVAAGVRAIHPDWPDDRVTKELLRRLVPAGAGPSPLR